MTVCETGITTMLDTHQGKEPHRIRIRRGYDSSCPFRSEALHIQLPKLKGGEKAGE